MNLLAGVNDVLKKVQIVSTTNPLTSLTHSGKQVFIDNAISSWNEAIDQAYSKSKVLRPKQGGEDSITLVENQREYDLPCDMVQIRWPLHNVTKGIYIDKYPGEYEELRTLLVQPSNYTGQPQTGAISPIDGVLYIDMIPTSAEAGDVYEFFYWKDTGLSRKTDVFPFSDTVYRALVPVVSELWRYNQNQRMSGDIAKLNYGRAIRALKQEPEETAWIKRGGIRYSSSPIGFDPYKG